MTLNLKIDSLTVQLLDQQQFQEIINRLTKLQGDIHHMAAAISAFKQAVDQAFAQVNTNLDNIQADEAGLAKQITDLQAQIAAGSSVLTAEDQAALDATVAAANAVAARTKTIADSVPDTVAPPVA